MNEMSKIIRPTKKNMCVVHHGKMKECLDIPRFLLIFADCLEKNAPKSNKMMWKMGSLCGTIKHYNRRGIDTG